MSEERRQILNMLAEGKISADEAEKLLVAIEKARSDGRSESGVSSGPTEVGKKLKSLCIMVEPKEGSRGGKKEKVNIRIPIQIIRAGMKLGSVLPGSAKEKVNEALKEKGIKLDINNLDGEAAEKLFCGLGEFSIDIDDENEKVRIYCE